MKLINNISIRLIDKLPDVITGNKKEYEKAMYVIFGQNSNNNLIYDMKLNNLKKYILTIVSVLILLLATTMSYFLDSEAPYLVSKDGKKYIERPQAEDGIKHEALLFKGQIDGEKIEKVIGLTIKPEGMNDEEQMKDNEVESNKDKILRELNSIVYSINKGDKNHHVYLPDKIEGIEGIKWEINKRNLTLPVLTVALIAFLCIYFSRYDELNKLKKKCSISIEEKLPEFLNKMVLLMNAGLVLTSAFQKIISDNKLNEMKKQSYFYAQLEDIGLKVTQTNAAVAIELKLFAERSGNREFMRVTNVISDNINKGTELVDILQRESEFLWFQRKKRAEEKGKIAETKLTFPLALQLLSLIMVTLAPTIINM